MFEMAGSKSTEESAQFFREWQRKSMFWCGPNTVKTFLAFRTQSGEIKTLEDMGNMFQLLGDLVFAMRKDLGLSNRGLDKKTFLAHLILPMG